VRDLDMGDVWNKLIWELKRYQQPKGKRTQNTMRDWIFPVQCGTDIDGGYNNVVWDDR